MKEVILSKYCDFCNGVERTIEICNDVLKKNESIYSIGQVIHNSQVIDRLKQQGLRVVKDISEVPENSNLLIRSHGISPSCINIAKNRGIKLINAACHFVEYIQDICKKLIDENYFVVITGDVAHPEVEALTDITGENGQVISDPDKKIDLPENIKKIGIISQSTYTREGFYSIIAKLLDLKFSEIRLFDTVCRDSLNRRKEAKRVASLVDMVWVIGGKNSANTKRLFQISKRINSSTYHLNNPVELDESFFNSLGKKHRIGIIGGASTPRWIIDAFLKKISEGYKIVSLEDTKKGVIENKV